ncbi:MAG: hypothetical protein CL840_01165 [Crocinitomicaceae bacterium]|nr:hypothetical protein [Crocinitomicaceae bacterium]|tara:strand:- start:55648 stop:56142 length:495 start_codon:yes stop_codon:yes gene_type:complete
MRNVKGFTLIELVIVIVILGILSAIAMPKLIDMSKDAKIAALEGTSASLQEAAKGAYLKSVVSGDNKAATTNLFEINGNFFDLKYGYPLAAPEIGSSVVDLVELSDKLEVCPGDGTSCDSSSDKVVIGFLDKEKGETLAQCFVRYTEPKDGELHPTIEMETSGC